MEELCSKSNGNGEFQNLTLEEYNYLIKKNKLFPALPPSAKNIETMFWGESFFGEYDLKVSCDVNISEKTDSTQWTIIDINNTIKKIEHIEKTR